MKKKFLKLFVAGCLAVPCAFAVTGCKDKAETPAHEHTYETEWSTSETHHWHASSCGHENEKGEYELHQYGTISYTWNSDNTKCTASRVCSDCDYKDEETVTATKTVTQNKTCTLDELSTMTATFTNSAFATQTKQDVKTADKTGHEFNLKGICTHDGCTENKGKTLTEEDDGEDVDFTPVGNKIYFNFTTIDVDYFWFDTETQQALESEITESTPCLIKSIKLYKDGDFEHEIAVTRVADHNDYYYFYWESDEALLENTKYYAVVTLDQDYDTFKGYFGGIVKYEDTVTFDSETNEKEYDGQPFSVTATSSKGLDVIVKYSSDGGTTWTDDVPTNAGTYKVKAYTEDTDTVCGDETDEETITITQKAVTLNWTAPENTGSDGKIVYDGTNHVGSITLVGVVDEDDCVVAAKDITVKGDNKNVTDDGFYFIVTKLSGAKSANYKLPDNCNSDTLYITKQVLTLGTVHATFNTTKIYNNTVILNSYLNSGSIAEGDVVKLNIAKVDSESGISVGVTYTNLYNGKDKWAITVSSESNKNYDLKIDEENNFEFVTDKVELIINAKIKVQFIDSTDGYTGGNAITLTPDMCENEFEGKSLTATLNIKFKKDGEYSELGTGLHIIDLNSSDWFCYLNSAWYTLSKASTITLEVYDSDITSNVLDNAGYTQDYNVGNTYYFKTTIATTGLYQLTTNNSDLGAIINDKQPVKDNLYLLEAGDYILVASSSQKDAEDGVIKLTLKTSTDITTNLISDSGYIADYNETGAKEYALFTISTDGFYKLTDDDWVTASILEKTVVSNGCYYLQRGTYVLEIFVNSAEDNQFVKLQQVTTVSITVGATAVNYSVPVNSYLIFKLENLEANTTYEWTGSFNCNTTVYEYEFYGNGVGCQVSDIDQSGFTTSEAGTYYFIVVTGNLAKSGTFGVSKEVE